MFEFYHNGGQDGVSYNSNPAIPTGVWVHHCIVKNGTLLSYYRNGTLASTHTITGGLNNPQPLYFGGDQEYSERAAERRGDLDPGARGERGECTRGRHPDSGDGGQPPERARDSTAAQFGSTTTYYFRSTFNYSGNPALTTLNLRSLVDDGAVVLNI